MPSFFHAYPVCFDTTPWVIAVFNIPGPLMKVKEMGLLASCWFLILMARYPIYVSESSRDRINPRALRWHMSLVGPWPSKADTVTGDKRRSWEAYVILMQVSIFFFLIIINFMVNTTAAEELVRVFPPRPLAVKHLRECLPIFCLRKGVFTSWFSPE